MYNVDAVKVFMEVLNFTEFIKDLRRVMDKVVQ